MRRLPVYLLLDTSGSMKGEPIEAVRCGIQTEESRFGSVRQGFRLRSLPIMAV